MRLLILQDQLRIGGTERQSLFLAERFAQAGQRVDLLIFRPGGHLFERSTIAGVRVSVLQKFDSGLSFWAPGLLRRIAEIAPEVIVCMGRTANCYAGFIQRKFPHVAVVGTLRTGKMLFPLHHWSMGVVRAVVANSNWWQRRMLERGLAAEKVHVVHNAVLLERSHQDRLQERSRLRQQYGISDDTCLFLNVATFRRGKRQRDLIHACAALRAQHPGLEWRLWLIGDGKEYRSCKHFAAAEGLGTRVRFFHFQADPFPYYAAADVAVSASREDSLPNFLVEAQAMALPIIAYRCRGVEETCIPGRSGIIVEPDDRDTMVKAMAGLAINAQLRQFMSNSAPAFAQERFSAPAQAERMLRFLESLAGSG